MYSLRSWAAAVVCAVPVLASAQQPAATGTITGRVTDAGSGRPVVGAQVFVPETRQGAAVGDNGTFTIGRVTTGPATIRVQMLGYEPVTQQVTVPNGSAVTVNVTLR